MIIQFITSFIGTVAFSILFSVPRKFYVFCGFTGSAGWLCYCLLSQQISSALSTFVGTMVVVLLSRIFAVWRRCPITVFLVSGIFPLVPGASVYYTAYYFVRNDLTLALEYGINALKTAFAIVLGIVFIVSIPRELFSPNYWKDRKGKKAVATK